MIATTHHVIYVSYEYDLPLYNSSHSIIPVKNVLYRANYLRFPHWQFK